MTFDRLNLNNVGEIRNLTDDELSNLNSLSSFVQRYHEFLSNWNQQRIIEFRYGFFGIRAGLRSLKKTSADHDKYVAPDFNIFRVLGIHSRENKTHSALLANLLDQDGCHGQGALFLDAFLFSCIASGKLPKEFENIAFCEWEVFREHSMDDGRMDLVLRHSTAGALIVIENKIYAKDQDRQLERYWNWMQSCRNNFPTQSLLYLTLYGSYPVMPPSEHINYQRISYKNDIKHFLDNILPEIKAPMVYTVVKQYAELIPSL
jgi:hypothetical protein